MPSSVELGDDYDAASLRGLAKRCEDPRQTRRLLALVAVYDGMSRAEAAKIGGRDRQTLRDWAHRFNAERPDGLTNRPGAGRPRRLSAEQMSALAAIIEAGPDPVVDGVRWRRVDLKRVIEERFKIIYSERSVSALLRVLFFLYRRTPAASSPRSTCPGGIHKNFSRTLAAHRGHLPKTMPI